MYKETMKITIRDEACDFCDALSWIAEHEYLGPDGEWPKKMGEQHAWRVGEHRLEVIVAVRRTKTMLIFEFFPGDRQ